MATTTRMTQDEHKEIYQTISESIVADPPAEKQEVDKRALRGALYLDEHHPGWARKINLDRFDIRDSNNCVVGQLVGHYAYVHKLFHDIDGEADTEAGKYGVITYTGLNDYSDLQESWETLIKERQ